MTGSVLFNRIHLLINWLQAQAEWKEGQKQAAMAKREKDKEDRNNQKKKEEDRKKKATEKTAKGERRSGRWCCTHESSAWIFICLSPGYIYFRAWQKKLKGGGAVGRLIFLKGIGYYFRGKYVTLFLTLEFWILLPTIYDTSYIVTSERVRIQCIFTS